MMAQALKFLTNALGIFRARNRLATDDEKVVRLVLILPKNSISPIKNPRAERKTYVKRPAGFYFMPSDWLSDPELKSCSLAAQGLWANVLCLMHQAPQYGVLKFAPFANWKFLRPLGNRKNLGSTTNRWRKSPENLQKISRKSPENLQKISVFSELAKEFGKDKDVIARRLLELVDAEVPSINAEGYLYSRRLVREGIDNARNRKRQKEWQARTNANLTRHPTPPSVNPPLSPQRGDTILSSFGNPTERRRRPTKAQIENTVGAETGNGSLAKFRETWIARGHDLAELEKGLKECDSDWRRIKTMTRH